MPGSKIIRRGKCLEVLIVRQMSEVLTVLLPITPKNQGKQQRQLTKSSEFLEADSAQSGLLEICSLQFAPQSTACADVIWQREGEPRLRTLWKLRSRS